MPVTLTTHSQPAGAWTVMVCAPAELWGVTPEPEAAVSVTATVLVGATDTAKAGPPAGAGVH